MTFVDVVYSHTFPIQYMPTQAFYCLELPLLSIQLHIPLTTLLSLLQMCLNLKDSLSKNRASAYVNCSFSCAANVMYYHLVKHTT